METLVEYLSSNRKSSINVGFHPNTMEIQSKKQLLTVVPDSGVKRILAQSQISCCQIGTWAKGIKQVTILWSLLKWWGMAKDGCGASMIKSWPDYTSEAAKKNPLNSMSFLVLSLS